jgi:hypothetical protein
MQSLASLLLPFLPAAFPRNSVLIYDLRSFSRYRWLLPLPAAAASSCAIIKITTHNAKLSPICPLSLVTSLSFSSLLKTIPFLFRVFLTFTHPNQDCSKSQWKMVS